MGPSSKVQSFVPMNIADPSEYTQVGCTLVGTLNPLKL